MSQDGHRQAEAEGRTNHQFSTDGKLVGVEKGSTKKPPQRPQIMVVGAVDVNLRQLLHQKGFLTDEDLASLLNPGPGPAGDPGDRETEGTS